MLDLGHTLIRRMTAGGPFVALHLRLEEDVWVRTGCSPQLGADLDDKIERLRERRPDLLTSRSKMTPEQRFAKGICPLTAEMMTR